MNYLNEVSIKLDELQHFIIKAKKEGFAKTDKKTSLTSETSMYTYRELPWCYTDTYWGNTIERGTEDVSFDLIIIWSMQYRGGTVRKYWDRAEYISAFLKLALINIPEEFPVRGPKQFSANQIEFEGQVIDGDFEYINTWQGDLVRFKGEEHILWKGKEVYYHDYIGGLNRNKHFPIVCL